MTVPSYVRHLSAVFVGSTIFLLTLSVAYEQFPWGSWRNHRHLAKRNVELAHLNLDELIAKRGSIPDDLSEVYNAEQWPHDAWNFPLAYRRTRDGYELKSLGSDGRPGGFGEATDLTIHDDDRHVTMPTLVEFMFQCVTLEVWLTAAVSGLIAAVMVMWAPTNSPRLPILNFLTALFVTGLVSWFIGTTVMALKVAPQH